MKEPQLLQTKAYDYLINLIKKGELETDKIYSLNQLAKEAGFSKTPFRDAVLRLEQERYIDILPSRGFTLHKMSKEDIIETYQMRNAIEIYCSKQLALHLDCLLYTSRLFYYLPYITPLYSKFDTSIIISQIPEEKKMRS